jgi:group I intron endonuclease
MNKICGIYKITSPTGKIYIGQSANIKSRITNYKNARCKCQQKLYHSIIKYGWDIHIFELIHECQESELNDLEAYYIKLYDTFNTEHGLNLTTGGDHYKMSDETKLKIGAASKLRVCSEETRKKLSENSSRSFLGKHHSEESKEKLRITHIGKKLTKEHRQKLSDSHKGYKATEEQKRKIGEAHLGNKNCLGRKLTKEHIEKMIESRKWYKHSEETINKIIESNKYRFNIKCYEIYDENNNLKYKFECINLQAELKKMNLSSIFQKSYTNKRKIKSGAFKGWYII